MNGTEESKVLCVTTNVLPIVPQIAIVVLTSCSHSLRCNGHSENREISKGNRNMENHETRRKVIRQ